MPKQFSSRSGRPIGTTYLLAILIIWLLTGCSSGPAQQPETPKQEAPVSSEQEEADVESGANPTPNKIQIIIPESTVKLGSSADVAVRIVGADGALGAATINLAYDSSNITITDCKVPEFLGVCNFSVPGELRIAGINANGTASDFVYANISAEGVSVGDAELIVSEVPTFANADGETVEFDLQFGTVTVEN